MSRTERHRRPARRDTASWQRRVWERIARDRSWRSGWSNDTGSNTVDPNRGSMSKGAEAPAVPLKHPDRLRPSWHRRFVRLALLGGMCAVATSSVVALRGCPPSCESAAQHKSAAVAVEVCRREYEETHDPATGVHLGNALLTEGDYEAATRVVSSLFPAAPADGFQLRGRIAQAQRKIDDAITALLKARELHTSERNSRGLVVDDGLLAEMYTDRSEFFDALRLADECIVEAERASERDHAFFCHIEAARALIQVGYYEKAADEQQQAALLISNDNQRSDIEYSHGSLAQDRGDPATAIAYYSKALEWRKQSSDRAWKANTYLNLAYAATETKDLDRAKSYLDSASNLDSDHERDPSWLWVAAQLAFRHHDAAKATAYIDSYTKLIAAGVEADTDSQIDVAALRAEIELEGNHLDLAAEWARCGIAKVEATRSAQAVLGIRHRVLAKRRAPYELLFLALARGGNADDAALAFADLQGRDLHDARATTRPTEPGGRRAVADQLARLHRWLQVVAQATVAKRADRNAALATMRRIDLLALIVAKGEVWALTASHGPPRLTPIAAMHDFEESLKGFLSDPTNDQWASKIGEKLPDEVFRSKRDTLHVVIDGQLDGVPLAAAQRNGVPLIALRPIVHALRLPESACEPVARPVTATVLAYSGGDLLSASTEAAEVGALLHTAPKIGSAATRDALYAARHDGVLHIAAHGASSLDETNGAVIALAGMNVLALEIAAEHISPSLVVLSACDAASSDKLDFERAGSLASGFLAAGTQHVVATLRSVTDEGAREISTRFYLAGGVADPPRALAAVQAGLIGTSNHDWPFFAVFGPDVCRDATPHHP